MNNFKITTQIIFSETKDVSINSSIDLASFTTNCMENLADFLNLSSLNYDKSNIKEVSLHSQVLPLSEFKLLVSHNPFKKSNNELKWAENSPKKLLFIYIQSGLYNKISTSVMRSIAKDLKSKYSFINSVLFTDKTISISFSQFTSGNVKEIYKCFKSYLFLHFENPRLTKIKN